MIPYIESAYSRSIVSEDSASHLTIDLWNFIKVSSRLRSSKEEGFNAEDLNNPWNMLKHQRNSVDKYLKKRSKTFCV